MPSSPASPTATMRPWPFRSPASPSLRLLLPTAALKFTDDTLLFAAIGVMTRAAARLPRLLGKLPISIPMVFLAAGIIVFALIPDPHPTGHPEINRVRPRRSCGHRWGCSPISPIATAASGNCVPEPPLGKLRLSAREILAIRSATGNTRWSLVRVRTNVYTYLGAGQGLRDPRLSHSGEVP